MMNLYIVLALMLASATVGVVTVLAYYWSFIKLQKAVKGGKRIVLLASPSNPRLLQAASTLIEGELGVTRTRQESEKQVTKLSVVKETE